VAADPLPDARERRPNERFDAVVVGSGFGGAAVARQLARAGLSVVVLERGGRPRRDETAWDTQAIHGDRIYRGDAPYVSDEPRPNTVTYPDEAVGGRSVFYGAASFRMRPEDFTADRFPADAPRPPDWPVTYDHLAPAYDEAEWSLGVSGRAGADPLEPPRRRGYPDPPAPYGTTATRIDRAGRTLGLSPFPIPLAINFNGAPERETCIRCMTCDLFPCQIAAKNDLEQTLLPDAAAHGAEIRPRTAVVGLERAGERIRAVECVDLNAERRYTIEAGAVIVSAGAIHSPALLLASGLGSVEPNGPLIGRYLMRHCAGIVIGIFPFQTNPERRFHKQVAFTDFYFGREGRSPEGPWGTIQSLQTPPPDYIHSQSPYPWFINGIGAWTLKFQSYLLCLAEDLPLYENRVVLDTGRRDRLGIPYTRLVHDYHPRDLAARRGLVREARRILRRAGAIVRVAIPVRTFSHAVGTCRFGTDPAESVLDPWCGFHGIGNLFVVDGSFMPSSAGVNPSLTIAAMGLRVGAHLADDWDRRVKGGAA
jgi:choline dehydrogenase-like flavoprotein